VKDDLYNDNVTEKLAVVYKEVLTELGENADREGLLKTPERVAKSLQFLTSGYAKDPSEILKSALFNESYSEMVIVKDIEVYSMCEHNM
jgi:GTP cyclohydrolase I